MALYTETRQWGSFKILAIDINYVVKELTVKPGKRLSYQSHEHRQEVWTPVSGLGLGVIEGELVTLNGKLPDPVVILCGQKHRIVNNWRADLVIVEIWTGNELREDDIIRYDDIE